ncbi:uncharacterized protein L969DRAFT_91978 [Mixia osmundae IAM 14324]|uniref:S13-like H2TH domain-containing protein n=1 Tax=Mixia osmundae (strain CBS 9802 / IAM 14324 / JCM 22182 / KY 12970) TaxID=764103 RepID=G7E2Z2_MIXOS|nr:uncharacterized protein L969DRAFT_91978 [Mixia osmundae IAM 14324]KEI42538.1 hypothetical protein L969DRAFT_91978 [Mixia osmundae IAM 14324]GAA97173.1 hypothetical protein E5Q_03849 [Mixia osmundae IAM 14324]
MILLGVNLPDRRLVKIALTAFHGISHHTSRLICARLLLHDRLKVEELSEDQLNSLSALLSSPATHPLVATPVQAPSVPQASTSEVGQLRDDQTSERARREDPLRSLILEADLRRKVNADIAHHRNIGNYRGRRHVMGLPVRGQRTHTNARTARKLNHAERRRGYATVAHLGLGTPSLSAMTGSSSFLGSAMGRHLLGSTHR